MSTGPKQAILAEFAGVARAIGHAHRLELLEHLGQGERSVEALADRVGLSFANASQHLQQLRRAGLVANRREGKFVQYRLADDGVVGLLTALRQQAERNLAEVDRIRRSYYAERDSLEPVSRQELLDRVGAGLVTVLDVCSADEFAHRHLPSAVNIPLGELQHRLAELDPDREVIAYCRGAYCIFAFEAVAALRAGGRPARRLVDGFPEWKAAGFPVSIPSRGPEPVE